MSDVPDFCEFGCSWECEHRPDRYGHVTVLPDGSVNSQPILDWYELFRGALVDFVLGPGERRAAHVARRRARLRVRRRARRRARVRR